MVLNVRVQEEVQSQDMIVVTTTSLLNIQTLNPCFVAEVYIHLQRTGFSLRDRSICRGSEPTGYCPESPLEGKIAADLSGLQGRFHRTHRHGVISGIVVHEPVRNAPLPGFSEPSLRLHQREPAPLLTMTCSPVM